MHIELVENPYKLVFYYRSPWKLRITHNDHHVFLPGVYWYFHSGIAGLSILSLAMVDMNFSWFRDITEDLSLLQEIQIPEECQVLYPQSKTGECVRVLPIKLIKIWSVRIFSLSIYLVLFKYLPYKIVYKPWPSFQVFGDLGL